MTVSVFLLYQFDILKPLTIQSGGITSPITSSTETVNDVSLLDEQLLTRNPPTANSQNSTGRPMSGDHVRQDPVKHFRSSSKTQAALAACNQHSVDAALGAGKGVGRIVGAGLKSPMDFTLGIARGFHNAPKLYGDDTVRREDKITDFQSGLKAAGKVSSNPINSSMTYSCCEGFWLWYV